LGDGSAQQVTAAQIQRQVNAHVNSLGQNQCTLRFP
jgi:hypothetical protein